MASNEHEIKSKFTLDGEEKFKRATAEIAEKQKTLSSSLKLVDEKLKSCGNSQSDAAKKTELLKEKTRLLAEQYKSQADRVKVLNDQLKHAKEQYGENSEKVQGYQRQLNAANGYLEKFGRELKESCKDLAEQTSKLLKASEAAGKVKDSLNKVGSGLTKGVTAPIMGISAASIAAFKDVDDGLDSIVTATGATGEAFDGLKDVFEGVFSTLPVDANETGRAIGELNTQFGLTGEALQGATEQALKFSKINGSDVVASVQGAKGVISAFGLETKDLSRVLDTVTKVAQDTGTSVDKVFDTLNKNSGTVKDLNLSFEEAAVLIGRIEQSGKDANKVFSYLSRASATLSKDGKTLNAGLAEFQSLVDSGAAKTEKMAAAAELFGQKGGRYMLEALETGALSFKDLAEQAEAAAGSVSKTFDATLDPIYAWKVALNNLKLAGSELGQEIQIALAPVVEDLINTIKKLTEWFKSLDDGQKRAILTVGGFAAALGPALSMLGRMAGGVELLTKWLGKLKVAKAAEETAKLSGAAAEAAKGAGGLAGAAGEATKAIGIGGKIGLWGAVAGLAVALGVHLYNSLTSITPEAKKLRDSMNDINKVLDDGMARAKVNAETSGALVDLLKQEIQLDGKSIESKNRINGIIEKLNGTYADLNLSYDGESEKLNKSTDALESYIKAKQQQGEELSKIDAYTAALQKQGEIEAEITKNQIELELKRKQYSKERKLEEAEDASINADLRAEIAERERSQISLNETLEIAKEVVADHKEAIDKSREATAEAARENQKLGNALGEVAESAEESAARQAAAAEEAAAAEAEALKKREAAYEQHLNAIHSAEIKQNEQTLEQQTQAFQANEETYKAYYANRLAIQTRLQGEEFGALRDYLLKLGAENTNQLDEIVNMTDGELKEYAAKFDEHTRAAALFADENTQSAIAAISERLAEGGVTVGEDAAGLNKAIIDAFVDLGPQLDLQTQAGLTALAEAIANNTGLPEDEARKLKDSILNIFGGEAEAEGSSPRQAGFNMSNSLAEGLASGGPETEQAAQAVMNKAVGALDDKGEGKNKGTQLSKGFTDTVEQSAFTAEAVGLHVGTKAATGLHDGIFAGNAGTPQATGENLGQSFAQGMRNMEQAVYNAGAALGKAGTKGVRDNWQIHSPSKVGQKLGGYFSEGIALGMMRDGVRAAEAAGRKLADATAKNVGSAFTDAGAKVTSRATGGGSAAPAGDITVNIGSIPDSMGVSEAKRLGRLMGAEIKNSLRAKGAPRLQEG